MATDRSTGIRDQFGRDGELPLGPTLLSGAVVAATLFPLVWVVAAALDAEGTWALLSRPGTWEVFLNSVVLVVAVTAACLVLGVPAAYLTARTDLPFRRAFAVLLALPLVIPSYIGAFTFVAAFGPRGTLQDLLLPIGIERLPSIYGLGGAALVLTLYTYPYVFVTTRAALRSMDTRLVDAARTLGHARREAFGRVVAPQIGPAVGAGSLLSALYALSDFGTPAIMRFDAFTRVIYVASGDALGGGRDLAALLSLQLVTVALVLLAVESRLSGAGVRSDRTDARARRVPLGRWRWPAAAACGVVVALALAVPLAVLGDWLVGSRTVAREVVGFTPAAVFNSVGVAGAAALAAALASLPVAYLANRSESPVARLFERAAYLGYAVPGVVMGLALVFFGAEYGGALYRNGVVLLPLLVFAYVVRFLPQSVGPTRAAFTQVGASLPEAARTLGCSPLRAFRRVTLPLVASGVLGGAALVFLTTMRELPATLLLRPAGFETLVTRLWTAYRAGYPAEAALPALALLVVSAVSMVVVLGIEGYDLG
jgi:iron(III) transport system permease protein